jgi:hypothetical protein
MEMTKGPVDAQRQSRFKRNLFVALAIVSFIVFALPVVAAFLLRPVARAKVIELLEERFDRVQLDTLDIRIWPGLNLIPSISASGAGLSLGLAGREDAPQFITMDEFRGHPRQACIRRGIWSGVHAKGSRPADPGIRRVPSACSLLRRRAGFAGSSRGRSGKTGAALEGFPFPRYPPSTARRFLSVGERGLTGTYSPSLLHRRASTVWAQKRHFFMMEHRSMVG